MREDELIVYKKFDNGDILDKMSRLFEHSAAEKIDVTGDRECLYECMNGLTEIAGRSGFYGNLWHCYLTTLLVNDENSYSMATEIRGNVEGTINQLALHDIAIFKEFLIMILPIYCSSFLCRNLICFLIITPVQWRARCIITESETGYVFWPGHLQKAGMQMK